MKVIAKRTCYTADNKRKKEGQVFNIKKEQFSFGGMALYMGKGKQHKSFENMKELEEFLAKPEEKEEEVEELEILDEVELDEFSEDVSEQEVI